VIPLAEGVIPLRSKSPCSLLRNIAVQIYFKSIQLPKTPHIIGQTKGALLHQQKPLVLFMQTSQAVAHILLIY